MSTIIEEFSDDKKQKKIQFKKNLQISDIDTSTTTTTTTTTIKSTYDKIILKDHQIDHYNKLCKILDNYPVVCDFSIMGSGKSFTSSYISINKNYKHVIVIGPVSIKPDWEKKRDIYGVPLFKFISYCSLRSIKGKMKINHGLLNRIDSTRKMKKNGTDIIVDVVDYVPTQLYKQLVSEGLLLIIDEIQSVKNINDQFKACKTLMSEIIGDYDYLSPFPSENKSRIMLLSGTPFDKELQIPHFFRLTSIMKCDELSQYNIQTYNNIWTGFNDIYNFSLKLNEKTTREIFNLPKDTGNNKILLPACYKMFQDIIKHEISHSMKFFIVDSKTEKRNAFYSIKNEEDRKLLEIGVKNLKCACFFNERNTNLIRIDGSDSLRQIQTALVQIETSKINTMARITDEYFTSYPTCKIVICVNYTKTIIDLEKLLIKYNPIIINGSVNINTRGKLIENFQLPNLQSRLIICNTAVTSTGINLDDQHGGFPRICLVSPNYNTIQLCQVSDRFRRSLTKSDSKVHFLYGKNCCELRVLDALAKKSKVIKNTVTEQVDIVFPCDYESFIENNEEELNDQTKDYLSKIV